MFTAAVGAVNAIFQALVQRFGWEVSVALVSALFALGIHLVISVLSPRLAIYNPRMEHKIFTTHSHIWAEGDILLNHGAPSYCNACNQLVIRGLVCVICGRCSHKEHLKRVSKQACKFRTKEDILDKEKAEFHQWIEGNLPIHATCIVCQEQAGVGPSIADLRCAWCRKCIHLQCLPKLEEKICCLGPIEKIVLPPASVSLVVPKIAAKSLALGSKSLSISFTKQPAFQFSIDPFPEDIVPILCAINPKSGSQNAPLLLKGLFSCLNPCQIWDLSKGSPYDFFMRYKNYLSKFRILCCGGDGTIGWILTVLDKIETEMKKEDPDWKPPPVGVLPLGTGNDMARVLNWGSGWSGESVERILAQVRDAREINLDRWQVTVTKKPLQEKKGFVSKALDRFRQNSVRNLIMNNYLSIGVDASIVLNFHHRREKQPHLFRNRMLNKVWYGLYGVKGFLSGLLIKAGIVRSNSRVQLQGLDSLESDDDDDDDARSIPSPRPFYPFQDSRVKLCDSSKTENFDLSDAGGLILLNIPSYAGGGNIMRASGLAPASMDDEKLQVLEVSSSFQLAASIVSLTSPKLLGECGDILVDIETPEFDMQVDGEPWVQRGPCSIKVKFFKKTTVLENLEKSESFFRKVSSIKSFEDLWSHGGSQDEEIIADDSAASEDNNALVL